MTRAARVAIVTPTVAPLGGTESIAAQEFDAIAAHADPVFVVPRGAVHDDGRRYAPVAVPHRPGVWGLLAWFRAADRAVRALNPAPDIVYSPGINGNLATHIDVYAVFAQWRADPPPAAVDPVEWARRLRFALLARWERRLYRDRRTRLATLSDAAAAELRRHFGRDDATVLWSTPDPDRFAPAARTRLRASTRQALGVDDDRFVVLTLGNAWWSKGFDVLAGAFRDPRLARAELWVVSLERRDRVARRVGGLPPNVRWLPRIADVEAYYAAADAVVLAGRGETFGLPIAEAGLMGVPVRTSAHAGVAGRVPDACVVGDAPRDWADALAALAADRDGAERAAAATRDALLTYGPADRRRDFLAWLGLA